jgi:hypothetical protein
MSPLAASSRIDYSQVQSLIQEGPSRPPPRRKIKRRQIIHPWTEEELNLLSYFRHHHRWGFKQIQKSFFPSLSVDSVKSAYRRLPTEDRAWRASTAASQIRNSHSDSNTQPSLDQGPNHPPLIIAGPFSQPGNDAETSILSLPSSATGVISVISSNSNINRYNLRPNRPTIFLQSKRRCLVDRRRFPHFYKSYRRHLNGLPDRGFVPPSHSPTPEPSDRSPSVVSGPPSVASSLELFGLETRSLSSSERDSSITLNDESSPEFPSSEERLPTP